MAHITGCGTCAAEQARTLRAEKRRLLESIGEVNADADGPGDYRVIAGLKARLADIDSALRGIRRRAA